MAKPTPSSANLAQQRGAQAARAFLNRPQAGQQGAPQNRAERRQAARMAGRQPKAASFDTAAKRAAEQTPVRASELVAAVPAAVGHSATRAALKVHRGFTSGAIFPVRDLLPALLFMSLVCVLASLWFGVAGLRSGALAPFASAISIGLKVAFGLGAIGLSWRSALPAVTAFGVSSWAALGAAGGPLFFNAMLAGFGLTLVWLCGPQVGDVTDSKKRLQESKAPH